MCHTESFNLLAIKKKKKSYKISQNKRKRSALS